jgi:hypothetical protein
MDVGDDRPCPRDLPAERTRVSIFEASTTDG